MEKLLDEIYKNDEFELSLKLLKYCTTEEQILEKYREVSEIRDWSSSIETTFMINAFLKVFRECALNAIMILHGYSFRKNCLSFQHKKDEKD